MTAMLSDPVVEYLTNNGEGSITTIDIPGLTKNAVKSRLIKLVNAGVLIRRTEVIPTGSGKDRMRWLYRVSGVAPAPKPVTQAVINKLRDNALANEPEHYFCLRNLPRYTNDYDEYTVGEYS
jgi:hypothetical protein